MIRRPPRSTLFPTRRSSDLFSRNSSKDFSFSNLQYCFDLTSHRYSPSSTNRASFSCSLVFSQLKIDQILSWEKTDRKSTRLNSNLVCRLLLEKKNNDLPSGT